MQRITTITILVLFAIAPATMATRPVKGGEKVFRAGAHAIDITPRTFPALVSGGFLERTADQVHDPLYARCLVLDDGTTRVAVAIVDSLLMPGDLLDTAKRRAHQATGIPAENMMIAATHTHSAPSVMGALGTGVDEQYAQFLPGRIAEGIELAAKKLAPARAGWTVVGAPQHTHCRRWIRRPDRIGTDPFGGQTVRAMMHPGYQNPDYVGPAGPADHDLSILAVQSPDGRPIALLANYSMHYFGAPPVSADYYGRFVRNVTKLIGAEDLDPPFVAIMSQGTSGDLHWMDYSRPRDESLNIDTYAQEVAQVAAEAYKTIRYHDWVSLAIGERELTLRRRVPDEQRLAWARQIVDSMQGRKPKSLPEVYSLEQLHLHDEPQRTIRVQALRIGDLGITAIPCEVFGITGLKIKAQSPLRTTFNLELANGAEGYIPPPEQHALGGYTTWPARSAGLEVQAEPKIVEAVLSLLEELSGKARRKPTVADGPYTKAVLASRPVAYWRLGEFGGPQATDMSGNANHGLYEDGVAFYLEGPQAPGFSDGKAINRSAHFAGGRMKAVIKGLGNTYTVEMCFFGGLPADARAVTGYVFSRGADGDGQAAGDHLGIGGTHDPTATGRLIVFNGNRLGQLLVGRTEIGLRTWNHVVMVRDGKRITVYLNGNAKPETSGKIEIGYPPGTEQLFVGGRNDNFANFEGKSDEVAVFDRALTPEEIVEHYQASGFASQGKP